tara:strand:- start:3304 stop:3558 length:255 start_codon:yes stop_codon:yes gene_type:complete
MSSNIHKLQKENQSLKEELQLYKSLFDYPFTNSCIFNLMLVPKDGKQVWIDKIKVTEEFLLQCEQTEAVKELLENIHPKYEKWV